MNAAAAAIIYLQVIAADGEAGLRAACLTGETVRFQGVRLL